MNYRLINIIIPSPALSSELINCLIKFNNQNYKNFFVTIVLDNRNNLKLPRLNYKLNILTVGKKNMSFKRNYAAKKFKSDLIAFIDSDAYAPKDWLLNGTKALLNKTKAIVGGPSIPFPNQKYSEMLIHYAKRSYFVTGYMNFRKYKSQDCYCDWLESCNLILYRSLFLTHRGFNENLYIGEDKEFIQRIKKKDKSITIFFTSKLFIYHKERAIRKFLMQRMVFGTDLFNIINFNYKIKSFQPIIPLLITCLFLLIILLNIQGQTKIVLSLSFISLIQILILFNIFSYMKSFKNIILTLIIINLANISYVVGNIMVFLNIKNLINRKIYLKSRNNK